jgi:uncharacterized pyridoxal phosphate-containing UPF0001 family protein
MTDDELRTILADRIESVRKRIQSACARVGRPSSEVTLIAVTKTVSPRVASVLPDLGIVDIGESRPQELWRKAEALKHLPIRWHLIGHLQRNKVERTLPLVHLIHSVDSARLLDAIAAESEKRQTRTRVLLEVNISGEAQKHGFDPDELTTLVANKNIEIAGLMGMAALSSE